MTESINPNFSIVRGDLPISPGISGGDFVKAEVTDTRLMGVVGVHIIRQNEIGEFHQLFYLDFEEYGIDDYRGFQLSNDKSLLSSIASSFDDVKLDMAELFGGLGGVWIEIDEREAIYLINDAFVLNKKYQSELPESIDEFIPILENPSILSESEKTALWHKICPSPENDYEVINYFIMRSAAMDSPGVDFLSAPEHDFSLIKMEEPGTLYRNEITNSETANNSVASVREYVTKSIISDDTGFRLILGEISVAGPWVTSFKCKEDMRISPWETSIIMAQNEFVCLLKLKGSDSASRLTDIIKTLYDNAEMHPHPGGNLFMILRKDNRHVARDVYRLDNDVLVSIFVRQNGEVAVAGSNVDLVQRYERVIKELARGNNFSVIDSGRFAFPDATLVHYIREDYGEFDSFLEFIQFLSNKE